MRWRLDAARKRMKRNVPRNAHVGYQRGPRLSEYVILQAIHPLFAGRVW